MTNIGQVLGKIVSGEFEQGFAELADAYTEGQNEAPKVSSGRDAAHLFLV